jgi:outer membrane protein OmpA-like peptidoglycan-associated protein
VRTTRSIFRMCLCAVLALVPLGCATRQQLLETETEMKGRMSKMEAGLATERQRVDALNTQVNDLNTQLGAVRQATTEARQRADSAISKIDAVDVRMANALANRFKRAAVKEFRVMFDTGKADLSAGSQSTLEEAVKTLAGNPTYTADVVGYTDDLGTAGSNVNLSWRREEVVRRFLIEHGAELNRLSFIGFGEDRATGSTDVARTKDRHVLVKIYRPVE